MFDVGFGVVGFDYQSFVQKKKEMRVFVVIMGAVILFCSTMNLLSRICFKLFAR